ncbi:MAG TPA: hypothetical protein VF701_10570 [Thermoanaerobaculia bacterium]
MTRRALVASMLLVLIACTAFADDTKLKVGKDETMKSVLTAQIGKRVTLKLECSEELTGIVRAVGDHTIHMGELTGKEFFDAVVDLDRITVVVIRVK